MWEAADFLAAHRWWTLVVLFLAAAVWEAMAPARGVEQAGLRWVNHLALSCVTLAVASGVTVPALEGLFGHEPRGVFAVAQAWGGDALVLGVGLLAVDLAIYASHRTQHALPALWRFHAVHHADARLDASTALRHHPLLAVAEGAALVLLLGAAGLPLWVWPIYALAWQAANFFAHADVRLPAKLDATLARLLVTPALHRLHHSAEAAHHDRNFGAVLSVWDRLFGTYLTVPEQARAGIVFGLPGHRGAGLLDAWALPFRRRQP